MLDDYLIFKGGTQIFVLLLHGLCLGIQEFASLSIFVQEI